MSPAQAGARDAGRWGSWLQLDPGPSPSGGPATLGLPFKGREYQVLPYKLGSRSRQPEVEYLETREKIRVLVVDDDENFLEAARALLASDERLDVVDKAASGEEAVAKVAALRPQVVAMDVIMPGMDGLEATRRIRSSEPACGVVLVSGSIFVDREDEGLEAARAAGASGYVLKSRAALDLPDAVISAARGGVEAPKRADPQ